MKRSHILQLAALLAVVAAGFALTFRLPQQPADVSSAVALAPGDLVQGVWQSEQDPAYAISFDGSAMAESYDGAQVSSGSFHFAASPAGYTELATETGSADEFMLQEIDGERYAYRVLELSPSRLALSYLERGNTLSFVRR